MAQAPLKAQLITQYGPYGSQEPSTFNFVLEQNETITKVEVESGDIVDSLGFVVVDGSGNTKTIRSDGSVTDGDTTSKLGAKNVNDDDGGHQSTTVTLNKAEGEQITQISGFVGTYLGTPHVLQLVIQTNKLPQGYGPFGRKQGTDIEAFSSPDPSTTAGPAVGFFGAQGTDGTYLHSIGISLPKGN